MLNVNGTRETFGSTAPKACEQPKEASSPAYVPAHGSEAAWLWLPERGSRHRLLRNIGNHTVRWQERVGLDAQERNASAGHTRKPLKKSTPYTISHTDNPIRRATASRRKGNNPRLEASGLSNATNILPFSQTASTVKHGSSAAAASQAACGTSLCAEIRKWGYHCANKLQHGRAG